MSNKNLTIEQVIDFLNDRIDGYQVSVNALPDDKYEPVYESQLNEFALTVASLRDLDEEFKILA